jgi:hypothetical protein
MFTHAANSEWETDTPQWGNGANQGGIRAARRGPGPEIPTSISGRQHMPRTIHQLPPVAPNEVEILNQLAHELLVRMDRYYYPQDENEDTRTFRNTQLNYALEEWLRENDPYWSPF